MSLRRLYNVAKRNLIECILMMLNFYKERGLPNIATMDLHNLFQMYREWNETCESYFGASVRQNPFKFCLTTMSARKLRTAIYQRLMHVTDFNLYFRSHSNAQNDTITKLSADCEKLKMEFNGCLSKLNDIRGVTMDSPIPDMNLERLNDDLEKSIAVVIQEFHQKLFY